MLQYRLENAQKELTNFTGIPANDQLWFHDRTDLLASFSGSAVLGMLPVTSDDNPIVLWTKPERVQGHKPGSILIRECQSFFL